MNEKGATLVLVLIFTTVSLFAVGMLHQQLHAAAVQAPKASTPALRLAGLGFAYTLLYTGKPPAADYACSLAPRRWFSGGPALAIAFANEDDPAAPSTDGSSRWRISVGPASAGLPACPASFGAS